MSNAILALLWALSFGFLFYGSIILPKKFPVTFVLGASVLGAVNIGIVNWHVLSEAVTVYRLILWCVECLFVELGVALRMRFALFCPVYLPFITAALRNSSIVGPFIRFLTDV